MESKAKRNLSGRSRVAKLNINNKIYNIYDGVNTIGRNREAIVNIKHLNVSQNHAIIITLNGDHFISDLNSSNGTYCHNRKVDPFKLERLEHNTNIKLGDVLGIYIIQGLDDIQSQNYSQSTQDLTQSIYGSTTQLLINSNSSNYLEDIHEAPTQAIIFTEFKVPRSVKPPEDDIHDVETQVIDIQKVNRDVSVLENGNTSIDNTIHKTDDICVKETNDISNTSNNSNLPLQSKTTVELLEDVYDDCLPFLENCNDDNKVMEDNDEEVTDCEDNIPTKICSSVNQISSQLVDNNSTDSTEFFKVTDDNLNTENNIVETDKNISKNCEIQSDQINEETKACPPNNNREDSTQCFSNASPLTKDEETDCEEDNTSALQLPVPSKFQNDPVDNPDSNDSSDFFRLNDTAEKSRCSLKSQTSIAKESSDTQNSTDIITFKKKKICQLSSDSETEDDLKVIRKRKSAMTICTQDLETEASHQNSKTNMHVADDEDSYIITETDSEVEIDVSNINTLEKSIPATQNQSTTDLNDTDCIPATQNVKQILMSKVKIKNSSQVTSESSESFKFGLTQMDEESQLSNKNINFTENLDDKDVITSDNINVQASIISEYDPTGKISSSPKQLNIPANDIKSSDSTKDIPDGTVAAVDTKPSNRTLGISDDTITDTELYGPTQKICFSPKPLNLSALDKKSNTTVNIPNDSITDTELYGPTQKIYSSPKPLNVSVLDKKSNITVNFPDDSITDTELYGPTQKIYSSPKHLNLSAIDKKPSNRTLGIIDDTVTDTELFGPTQKICTSSKLLNVLGSDRQPNKYLGITDDDTMNDLDIYGPTQKICISPKQSNISIIDRKPSNITLGIDNESITDTDIYGPTQKIYNFSTPTVDRKPSNKTLGVINDIITECDLNSSAQKPCLSPKTLNMSITDRKPSKKSLGITDDDGIDSDLNDATQKIDADTKLCESTNKKSLNKLLDASELYLGNTQKIKNPNEVYELNMQDSSTKMTLNTQNENMNQLTGKFCNSKVEDDIFDAQTQVVPVVEIPKVQKFSFKKMEYNLDKSLSTLLKDDSIVEPVKESIDINFDNIEIESTNNRPNNPVSNVLDQTKETDEVEYANVEHILEIHDSAKIESNKDPQERSKKQKLVETRDKKRKINTSEENSVLPRKSSARAGQKKITLTEMLLDHDKLKLEEPNGFNDQEAGTTLRKYGRKNSKKTYREKLNLEDNEIKSNKQKTVSSGEICDEKRVIPEGSGEHISEKLIKNEQCEITKEPSEFDDKSKVVKSNIGRTRKRLESTDSNQSSDMNIKARPKRENKKAKISLVVEDITKKSSRNSKRMLRSSHELNDVAVKEEVNQELKNNITTIEGNQSIALLESKITKTKRAAKKTVIIDDLDLKVPKNRRSMAIVEQNETLEQPNSSRISVTSYQRVKKKQNISKEVKKKDSTQVASDQNNTVKTAKILKASKRKNVSESTACENRESGTSAVPSTPKKQKLIINESVLLSSSERAARRQKPKVVFTMMDSPQMESLIRQLGGSIIDSVSNCTVLVTEHVKRSQKLLCAVGLGKPICSPQWVLESKKSHEFLDPWNYILQDLEAEAKWNFTLKTSLMKSKEKKLLENYQFMIQVTTAVDVLKGAIEACGGKCITKIPNDASTSKIFVISSMDNQNKYKRILKQHPSVKVIAAEAIFDGVLRQELRFSNHFLN